MSTRTGVDFVILLSMLAYIYTGTRRLFVSLPDFTAMAMDECRGLNLSFTYLAINNLDRARFHFLHMALLYNVLCHGTVLTDRQ